MAQSTPFANSFYMQPLGGEERGKYNSFNKMRPHAKFTVSSEEDYF